MALDKLDVTTWSDAELQEELNGRENEYQRTKFDHAVKGIANPMEIRELRRNVARIHTEIRKRELAAMTPAELELRSKKRARRRKQ